MRKTTLVILIAAFTCLNSSAFERYAFMGGFSSQNPTGGLKLEPANNIQLGIGIEAVKDLVLMLKMDFPVQYNSSSYPLKVNINGADSSLHFRKFTAYNLMFAGNYILPVYFSGKLSPKIFGGLGLYWLYNSQESIIYPNVVFQGLGPEFGAGMTYKLKRNIWLDFTVSIKMPTYLEYKVENTPKTPVGIDEQYIGVHLGLYYFID